MKFEEIGKALDDFRRDNMLKDLAAETVKYYDTMLTMFAKSLKAFKVKQLSQECVDDYKLFLMSTQNSKASVNAHLRAIRRFVNFVGLPINVAMIKEEDMPKCSLNEEDIQKVIDNATPENKYSVIAMLLLSTGIRSATVRAIQTGDVNIRECSIVLRHTKNKKPYVMPLVPEILEILKKYIARNNKKAKDLLFTTRAGKALTKSALWQRLAKYFEKIGVDKTGVHIFRHTFAKTVCMNGLNNAIILMRLLGHSSVQQAQHYVNMYGNELREAMEKYNPIFCN